MKWNLRLLFYSKLLKAVILWFVVFEFGLRTSAYKFLLQLQSWSIWVKMCDISCGVKICKWVQWSHKVCKTFKPSWHLRRTRKFFVTGEPVIGSCKTALTQKALSCLYFRKTKSEAHIVRDLFGYTGPIAKRQMRPCYVPSISNNVAIDGFLTVEFLCNGDAWIKIQLWYSWVFTRTGTERERRFQWKWYRPRIIVICMILQASMISAEWFLANMLAQ